MTSNTFSLKSNEYAAARPRYPLELFNWLASQCPRRTAAWDCATGTGQGAEGLAAHFEHVFATDVSAEQIAAAKVLPNVSYRLAPAEASGLAHRSCDLVTVAQALHWFDYDKFWPEVQRVARPGGLFCAWGYDWLESTPEIDNQLVAPFREAVLPFWAPNNQLLWEGYPEARIAFPFQSLETPAFAIELSWSPSQILDYLLTWSAYKTSTQNVDTSQALSALLINARASLDWQQPVAVKMRLKLRAGRIL